MTLKKEETLDIEAAQARCDAATEGPWESSGSSTYAPNQASLSASRELYTGYEGEMSDADSDFIAHARTDLPLALAEIRRLRERTASLEIEMAHEMGKHYATADDMAEIELIRQQTAASLAQALEELKDLEGQYEGLNADFEDANRVLPGDGRLSVRIAQALKERDRAVEHSTEMESRYWAAESRAQSARVDALEEAAKYLETEGTGRIDLDAPAIRALMSKPIEAKGEEKPKSFCGSCGKQQRSLCAACSGHFEMKRALEEVQKDIARAATNNVVWPDTIRMIEAALDPLADAMKEKP